MAKKLIIHTNNPVLYLRYLLYEYFPEFDILETEIQRAAEYCDELDTGHSIKRRTPTEVY